MDLGITRRNIGRLVLLAWAVMLAWLARREFTRDEATQHAQGTMRLAPAAQYFGVYAAGRQIGQLNLTVDTLVDGVSINELLVLDVPRGIATQQLTRGSRYGLSRSLRLRQYSRSVVGIGPQERLDGEAEPDSTFRLVQSEAPFGAAGRARLRVLPEEILPGMMPYRVAFSDRLHVGAEFSLPVIDLEGGGVSSPSPIRVTAESTFVVPDSAVWDSAGATWIAATTDTIRAWRIEHITSGAPTVSWVDAGGVLVYRKIGGGVTLQRSAFEIIRNNYRAERLREPQGWRRAIPGMVPLTAARRAPDTLATSRGVVLRGDSAEAGWVGIRELAGGRQQVRGDTVLIARHTAPDSGPAPSALALAPTWDLPIRDGGVVAAANEATAGALTKEDSARRLTQWVARQIATDTGATGSVTALFTLRARGGTALGKARLLAAMARAGGIPSRVVSGLAVLPDASYGHTWAELWLGRWVAVDPSFGHFPASASLLRLTVAAASSPLDLVFVVGSARFLPIRVPR